MTHTDHDAGHSVAHARDVPAVDRVLRDLAAVVELVPLLALLRDSTRPAPSRPTGTRRRRGSIATPPARTSSTTCSAASSGGRNRYTVTWAQRTEFVVHYSEGPTGQSVRSIQDFHMGGRGWADIGYNFLVDVRGRIFAGRGWLVFGARPRSQHVRDRGVHDRPRRGRNVGGEAVDPVAVRRGRPPAGPVLEEAWAPRRGARATSCRRGCGCRDTRARLGGRQCPAAAEIAEAVWNHPISNKVRPDEDGDPRLIPARKFLKYGDGHFNAIMAALKASGVDVDEDAIVRGVLADLTPERFAAAIPPEIAERVVTALGARLTPQGGFLKVSKYWKGAIAGLGPVLLLVQAAVDDQHVDMGEGVGIVTAALVAAGVIAKRNAPPAQQAGPRRSGGTSGERPSPPVGSRRRPAPALPCGGRGRFVARAIRRSSSSTR